MITQFDTRVQCPDTHSAEAPAPGHATSMTVFYSPDYTLTGHDFDTTRKAGWVATSLKNSPIVGVDVVAPQPLSVTDLLTVHDDEYVDAVGTGKPRGLAESQGFTWDEGLLPMVLTTNGGVLAAARAALTDGVSGSLSSGLHHAKCARGDGFCTFNGLAIAAKTLLAEGAVGSVLILDFDAHCGGGTASLIADDPRITQVDVSVSLFDWYAGSIEVTCAEDYLPAIRRALDDVEQAYDLVLYNAGMDLFQGCDIGGLDGITTGILAAREQLVFQRCRQWNLPVAFVLAGGYIGSALTTAQLVELHRRTITSAAGRTQQTRHTHRTEQTGATMISHEAPNRGNTGRVVVLGDRDTIERPELLHERAAEHGTTIVDCHGFDRGEARSRDRLHEVGAVVDALRRAIELRADIWVPFPFEDLGREQHLRRLDLVLEAHGLELLMGRDLTVCDDRGMNAVDYALRVEVRAVAELDRAALAAAGMRTLAEGIETALAEAAANEPVGPMDPPESPGEPSESPAKGGSLPRLPAPSAPWEQRKEPLKAWVAKMTADGMTQARAAEIIQKLGHRPPRGGVFTRETVSKLLRGGYDGGRVR